MSVSLYRRFRPSDFSELIGQEHIVRTLTNQIKNGRVSHAYLFTGTRGTGKTSTAKIFAKAVNCLHPENGSPCGKCQVCEALSNPANLDVIEIDAASNNGVEEIRTLKENVNFSPSIGKYKVYIIDEVHMLSVSAFNALLKTIEEPPSHVIFILATTEVHKLPQTILSRCQRFDFRLVPEKVLKDHIARIFKKIGVKADDRALELIARHGEGSVRDAISLADMLVSFSDGKLTGHDVEDALGLTSFETLAEFAENILSGNVAGVLNAIDVAETTGRNLTTLAKDLSEFMLTLISVSNLPRVAVELSDKEYARCKEIADRADGNRIVKVLEILSSIDGELRYTVQPRIIFTAFLVKAASMHTDVSLEGSLTRIRALEKRLEEIEKKGVIVAKATETDEISQNSQASEGASQKKPIADSPLIKKAKIMDVVPVGEPDDEAKSMVETIIEILREKGEKLISVILSTEKKYSLSGEKELVFYPSGADAAEMLAVKTEVLKEAAKAAGASSFRVADVKVEVGDRTIDDRVKRNLGSVFGSAFKLK